MPRRPLAARLPIALAFVGASLLAGCHAAPPAVAPPPIEPPAGLEAGVRHVRGSALASGSVPTAAAAAPAEPLALHVELLLLAELAVDGMPLGAEIAASVDPTADGALRLPSRAAEQARLFAGAAARAERDRIAALASDRRATLFAGDDVVVAGFTTWSGATAPERFDDRDDYLRERSTPTVVSRRFAIALDGRPDGVASVTLERGTPGLDGELWKLARPLALATGPLLVVVPSCFSGSAARACAAWIELAPAPASGEAADRFAAMVAELRAAEATVAPLAVVEPLRDERVAAFAVLPKDASGRTALCWMTARVPDSLAGELALVASDDELADWLARLAVARERLGGGVVPTGAQIDAALQEEAWGLLATLGLRGDLPAELASLALRHAGAAGAFPTTLAELAHVAGDPAQLATHLAEENVLLLADGNAAVRVRAYDWLAARKLAPAGFDPLAPLEARRKALAALESGHE